MKVENDKRSDRPSFKLEATDTEGIIHLRQLVAGKWICPKCNSETDNTAWRHLQGYFSALRLWVEELGKSHAQSRAKKDLCSNDLSILTGIDLAIQLPAKLINQADMQDKIIKEKQEAKNDGRDEQNDYGD